MLVAISRHAIERYIERVEAVEELEAHSRIAGMIERSKFFGSVGRVLAGNVSLVVEGATVVTVLTREHRPKRKTARRMIELDDDV